jgi:hypothetical protein
MCIRDSIKSEDEMTLEEALAQIAALKKENSDFSEGSKAKDDKIKQLEGELIGIKKAALSKELNEFCDGLIEEGKLIPAKKAMIMKQLEVAAQSGAELNFSEDGTEKKVSALDNLKTILKDGPVVVEFAERIKNGSTQNGKTPEAEEGDKIAATLKNN